MPKLEARREGATPVIKSGDIIHQKSPFIYECKTFLDDTNITNHARAKYGDILLIHKNGVQVIGRSFVYLRQEESVIGSSICVIKHQQNPKYLLHTLNSPSIQKQIKIIAERQNSHQQLRYIGLADISNISIPWPPLDIQEQIANYLNDVVVHEIQLSESLEKMLEIRKKQCEYYKEQLLTSDLEKWDIKTIEEISIDIYSGTGVTKAQLNTGNYPAVKCGDVNSELPMHFHKCISFIDHTLIAKPKYFEHGDILVGILANKIKNIGKVSLYLGHEKCILGSDVVAIKTNQNPKYLTYALASNFCKKQIKRAAIASSVVHLYAKDLKKIRVPLPPLETQEQIVSILEKLDSQISKLNKDIQELTTFRKQQCQYLTSQII